MSIGSKEEKERRIALGMGVVMVVVGFGATFLNWRSALTEGRFDGDEAIGGPLAGFIGLVLLLPSAEDADDGRRKLLRGLAQTLFCLAFLAAAANCAVMYWMF